MNLAQSFAVLSWLIYYMPATAQSFNFGKNDWNPVAYKLMVNKFTKVLCHNNRDSNFSNKLVWSIYPRRWLEGRSYKDVSTLLVHPLYRQQKQHFGQALFSSICLGEYVTVF